MKSFNARIVFTLISVINIKCFLLLYFFFLIFFFCCFRLNEPNKSIDYLATSLKQNGNVYQTNTGKNIYEKEIKIKVKAPKQKNKIIIVEKYWLKPKINSFMLYNLLGNVNIQTDNFCATKINEIKDFRSCFLSSKTKINLIYFSFCWKKNTFTFDGICYVIHSIS